MIDTPFPETGARRWFRHDGSAWVSNGHFAVRLPWIDVGDESFSDDWRELRDASALFAWPYDFVAQARFSLANNTAAVAFVVPRCRSGCSIPEDFVAGLVAPRRGPDLWVEPEEARRVAHLADEAARAVDRFAADMRAIAKRVLGGGVP